MTVYSNSDSAALSARPAISLNIAVSNDSTTYNSSTNTSKLSWRVYLRKDASNISYSYDPISSWSASIAGNSKSGSFGFDFSDKAIGYELTLGSGTNEFTITHNSDGSKSINFSASVNADVIGSASTGTTALVMYDAVRVPLAPIAAPTIVRNGTYLDLTSAVVGTTTPALPTITYEYRQSTSNSFPANTSYAITNATGTGSAVTYTSSGHPFAVNDVVTVTGISPSAFNTSDAVVTAVTSTTFRVSDPGTGTYSSGGSAALTAKVMPTPPSAVRISGLGATTFYYYQTRGRTSDGPGAWSPTGTAFVVPAFTNVGVGGQITTLPYVGVVGQNYPGTITATNATTFTMAAGSNLPPGVTLNTITTSGTSASAQISGLPTFVGVYSFAITATGPGGSTTSPTQTIVVSANGPWVYLSTPTVDKTITQVQVASNVATITAASHGITEFNQPLTISGLTGAHAVLNGTWPMTSYTTNTVSFSIVTSNISPAAPIGATPKLQTFYKRTNLYVRSGGSWVNGYARVYDTSYTDSNGTHWRPIF